MYQGGSAVGLVLGAGCCLFWWLADGLLFTIPISLILLFLLWKVIPKIPTAPQEGKGNDSAPKRHGKVIDIPGVITMALTTSTFMLCFTFLGKGSEGVDFFGLS